jgi:hypothetical protein
MQTAGAAPGLGEVYLVGRGRGTVAGVGKCLQPAATSLGLGGGGLLARVHACERVPNSHERLYFDHHLIVIYIYIYGALYYINTTSVHKYMTLLVFLKNFDDLYYLKYLLKNIKF